MAQPAFLALCGSKRQGSFNFRLLQQVAKHLEAQGASVTIVNLRDYPLPLFDEDLEATDGLPENVHRLKALCANHHGFLIASPEYNSMPTPLLKNTIDWLSRRTDAEETPLASFKGKTAGLVAASPGAMGGIRGLPVLRQLLQNIGVTVVPQLIAVPKIHDVLATETDTLPNPYAGMADELAQQLLTTTSV